MNNLKTMLIVLITAVATIVEAQQANSLARLRQAYETQQQSILTQYSKDLETIIVNFKKKGDLDNVLILQAEKKRFDAEKTVPAPADTKVSFRPASEAYHKSIATLLNKYVTALDGLVKKETSADRIEEAKLVKAEKDKIDFILADVQTKLPATTSGIGKEKTNPQVQPQQAQRPVFERTSATFQVLERGKIKDLKKGCILYADKEHTMKERPRQLVSTSFVMAPFSGCTTVCQKAGIAFALGLYDPENQRNQTETILSYLKSKGWIKIEEIPTFVLFYTNGADRKCNLYWKEIKKDEEVSFPPGMILCFKKR